ncbi:hypothetical protein [Chryseobacterium sp.]|uniref:hypothetical protein n=1 Tax=Chryseobacterium sp. TaxID=1871047 RepID=UPI0025C0015B|nr:hypothetical protein [Chryseobacterium sp.]
MPITGKIIRVNELPPIGKREKNVIYQVAEIGSATYTDYAIDETGDLKTHAVVDGTIPLELADNHISISDPSLVSAGFNSQAEYNISTKEKLDQKLEIPSTDGNAQDYPKIIGMDDNGNIAKLPAGDLGKNIANSSLTSVDGAGLTLGANWTLNTSGLYYSITGLSDVSSDSTFNTFLSQNSSGRIGKTNGKQPFLSLPSTLTEAERTAWKTAMNGGWTTNTMSVGLINPSVVRKLDAPQYITLVGANLNMPSTSFSVEIMDSTGTTVVAVVPNSQVQIQSVGTSLIFWYNFKNLAETSYKIRLWNGVASYTTPMTFVIASNILTADLSSNTWDTVNYSDKINPTIVTSNTSITMGQNLKNADNTEFNEMAGIGSGNIATAALSSPIIIGGSELTFQDNFVIELGMTYTDRDFSSFGICADTINSLTNSIQYGISMRHNDGALSNYISPSMISTSPDTLNKCTIVKNANLISVAITAGNNILVNSTAISSNSEKVRIKALKRVSLWENHPKTASFTILSAYKF